MRRWILEGFFLVVLIGLTVAFFRVLAPFLLDVFFAMAFVSMSWPLLKFYEARFKVKRRAAALLVTLTDALLVLIPLGLLTAVFSIKTFGGIRTAVEGWPATISDLSTADVIAWLESIPVIGALASLVQSDLAALITDAVDFGSRTAARMVSRSVTSISATVFHLFILLFLMFFLFKDGQKLEARIRDLLPLSDDETAGLLTELRNTTAAALTSTVLVAFFEGLLGGLLFVIFGLPSPLLFASLMAVVSLIPLVGTNLVLVPAGVILILQGRLAAGIIIIAVGLAGAAVTQNIIKPKLLGDRSGLHPALALLAILGGIAWLGIMGFVIGPLLISLFIVIWDQFGRRYRTALESRNADL